MKNPASRPRSTSGRWYLFRNPAKANADSPHQARVYDAAMESAARVLLCRYGVLFRDLLKRETTMPKWRELVGVLRRLEARGEVRGGRFVSGFSGEQYALPAAVESLRMARIHGVEHSFAEKIDIAAVDPMNLVDIIVPGKRQSAISGRLVSYRGEQSEFETPLQTVQIVSQLARARRKNPGTRSSPIRKKSRRSGSEINSVMTSHQDTPRQQHLFRG